MLVFLFIVASVSLALPTTNAVANCSVCDLSGQYSESNGYNCFQLSNGNVACTCPDQQYTLNKACRICDREKICGDNPKTFCAESTSSSLGVNNNETYYFACFCADDSFLIGKACPSTFTTITTTTTATAVPLTTPVINDQ